LLIRKQQQCQKLKPFSSSLLDKRSCYVHPDFGRDLQKIKIQRLGLFAGLKN
jgi:hypothetical protein